MIVLNVNPVLLDFGFYKINIFGVWAIVSLGIYFVLLNLDLKKTNIMTSEQLFFVLNQAVLVGIFGAKILFVVEEVLLGRTAFLSQNIFSGFSLMGAFCLLPLYFLWVCQSYKINFLKMADFFVYRAPILQALLRISCFLAGCCYGFKSSGHSFLSVMYLHPKSLGLLGQAVFPSQLLSLFLSVMVFVGLFFIKRRGFASGAIFGAYLFLEGVARFVADFTRFERVALFLGFFSLSQTVSLVVAILGGLIFYRSKN